jgi:outer membrane protein W
MKRILLSTMLLAAVSANVFAGGTEDMGQKPVLHVEPTAMPIAAIQACEPAVKEGQWTFTARAGIAPTVYGKQARSTHTISNSTFKESYSVKEHGLPFTTGVDVGYAVMDNVEGFFNFDYSTASGKKRRAITHSITFAGNTDVRTTSYKQGNFNSYGFYLGGRYFFDLDCKFSPFIGAKLGLLYRTHGKHTVTDRHTYNGIFDSADTYKTPLFKNSTAFSAGLQLGADYRVAEQVSLFVMSEVIGSTKPKTNKNRNAVYTYPHGNVLYSKVTRSPGASFSFPITAGVKVRM